MTEKTTDAALTEIPLRLRVQLHLTTIVAVAGVATSIVFWIMLRSGITTDRIQARRVEVTGADERALRLEALPDGRVALTLVDAKGDPLAVLTDDHEGGKLRFPPPSPEEPVRDDLDRRGTVVYHRGVSVRGKNDDAGWLGSGNLVLSHGDSTVRIVTTSTPAGKRARPSTSASISIAVESADRPAKGPRISLNATSRGDGQQRSSDAGLRMSGDEATVFIKDTMIEGETSPHLHE